MSDPDTTAPDPGAAPEPGAAPDPGAAPEPGAAPGYDEHGDTAEALGPIDVAAWAAGVLGVGISVAIAIAFVMATSNPG